jgi:hypothetical protein
VDRECTISCGGDIFQLKYNGEMIYILFETRIVREKLSSDLVFAYAVLKNILLHSLAYGILCQPPPHIFIKRDINFKA